MQVHRVMAAGTAAMLVLVTLSAQAALYKWVDQHGVTRYGDRPPPGVEVQQMKERDAATAEATEAEDSDAAAKERIRENLQKQEEARAGQRKENCERARAELKRLADIPARNVMRTDAQGNITRSTEEELQAELADLRRVESENCA